MHYDGSVLVTYLLLEADGRYGATSSFCEQELWCSESGDRQLTSTSFPRDVCEASWRTMLCHQAGRQSPLLQDWTQKASGNILAPAPSVSSLSQRNICGLNFRSRVLYGQWRLNGWFSYMDISLSPVKVFKYLYLLENVGVTWHQKPKIFRGST